MLLWPLDLGAGLSGASGSASSSSGSSSGRSSSSSCCCCCCWRLDESSVLPRTLAGGELLLAGGEARETSAPVAAETTRLEEALRAKRTGRRRRGWLPEGPMLRKAEPPPLGSLPIGADEDLKGNGAPRSCRARLERRELQCPKGAKGGRQLCQSLVGVLRLYCSLRIFSRIFFTAEGARYLDIVCPGRTLCPLRPVTRPNGASGWHCCCWGRGSAKGDAWSTAGWASGRQDSRAAAASRASKYA